MLEHGRDKVETEAMAKVKGVEAYETRDVTRWRQKVAELKPEGSSLLEEWNECAVDVGGHEGLDAAEELSTHEDGGERLVHSGELEEQGADGGAGGVVVELHHRGADPEAEEQAFGHRGHAAIGGAEHHDGVARREAQHHFVRAHRCLHFFHPHS
ncbi:unnamed protein product [Sphenostylis stenocarpa]|uniref:Uncharacterized protein n=1 Tax=Sphenostylis stenocarpa TaxID=92480 RepID=A0AA86RYI5_9FABA|nr:unnamed protein product [Sphenostylis stenocarpa]